MKKYPSKFLADLREKRLKHVKSCEENNIYAHRLLAEDIYTNPTRFVYELLQNAEDAGAKKAHFQLMHRQLNFSHDGKAFSKEDVESITAFGASTKLSEEGKIGKFGVGFKSVHSVTKTPRIHSEEFHFQINDYIVPNEIPSDKIPQMGKSETRIVLPFHIERDNAEESYKRTLTQLENLNANCLLFLRHIGEISWEDKSGERRDRYTKYHHENYVILEVDAGENENEKCRKYLAYDKKVSINDKTLKIHLAYRVDENEMIVPAEEKYEKHVFVFFPTNENSHLKFCIQAPYKPILSREGVNFDDEENHQLTQELAYLVSESLADIKKRGMLTPDFFRVLPTDITEESHHPSAAIASQLLETMKREPLLPAHGGKRHVKAEDSLLPQNKSLIECLDSADIAEMFERKFWLSPDLVHVSDFLQRIGVESISIVSFLNSLQECVEVLKRKNHKWFIGLYGELNKYIENGHYTEDGSYNTTRRGKVGKTPIILLSDGCIVSPWGEDNKPKVYLPYKDGHDSDFPTVNREIAKSSKANMLFKNLDLHEPDEVAEIKEKIAPQYSGKKSAVKRPEYIEHLALIYQVYFNSNDDRKTKIRNILKNVCIVRTGDGNYVKPAGAYLPSDNVKTWFSGNCNVHIVDEKVIRETKSRDLFEYLGCREIDGVAKNDAGHRFVEKWVRYERSVNGFNPNFDIDGISYAMENINILRSFVLWRLMLNRYRHIRGCIEISRNQRWENSHFDEERYSVVGETLATKPWLYDNRENLINPDEYDKKTIDDLHESYERNESADRLATTLGLSSKVISHEEHRKILSEQATRHSQEISEQETRYSRILLEKDSEIKRLNDLLPSNSPDDEWSPECLPGEGELTEVAHGQFSESHSGMGRHGIPEKSSKSVGDWGEKDIYYFLKRNKTKHDVEWCNENGEQKNPFDIVVKNGDSTVYVEVKSTRNDFPQAFNFTKSEWEFAEEQGDNYHVYFVSRAGKQNREFVRVENPMAEQQAGRLHVMVNETVTYRVRVNKSDD